MPLTAEHRAGLLSRTPDIKLFTERHWAVLVGCDNGDIERLTKTPKTCLVSCNRVEDIERYTERCLVGLVSLNRNGDFERLNEKHQADFVSRSLDIKRLTEIRQRSCQLLSRYQAINSKTCSKVCWSNAA